MNGLGVMQKFNSGCPAGSIDLTYETALIENKSSTMAIFQYGNRTLPYSIDYSPVSFDLLLLQPSNMTEVYWVDVLGDIRVQPRLGGRVVTVGWSEASLDKRVLSDENFAEDLAVFISSIGLVDLHIVAAGDAVGLVAWLQKHRSEVVKKSLLYPDGVPKSETLIREIRQILGVA